MTHLVILAPNWLGDAVMALPAIADVRRAAPGATIVVAARPAIAPLFDLVPEVNGTIVLDRQARGVSAWRSLGSELATRRFDTALLLPNSVHAALIVSRAGIPERWGYRTNWRGTLLTRAVPTVFRVHQVEYYQHLVQALGFPNGPGAPNFVVPSSAQESGRAALLAAGWNGSTRLVALAPGAAYGGAKRWPPEYFGELSDALGIDDVQCVMIGAAADRATAEEIRRPAILDLVGKTDLATLAGVLSQCRALVTNDSGAMHLAAAIGISVTAMFGPTNEVATAPRSPNPESRTAILTHQVWCRPCMLRECPIDHRCMRGIDPRAAIDATRQAL
jgi:lipopolysaccharide heptosyltransferase II